MSSPLSAGAELYAAGDNFFGQLGISLDLPNPPDTSVFVQISAFRASLSLPWGTAAITLMDAGEGHTLVVAGVQPPPSRARVFVLARMFLKEAFRFFSHFFS